MTAHGSWNRALIIEHHPDVTAGLVGERLRERGFELTHHRVVTDDLRDDPAAGAADFPDPCGFALVVLLGAPWAIYDHEVIGDWLGPEMGFVRRAHEHAVPTLGICFGGQLLAAALGGRVYASERPEIGWTSVTSLDEELIPGGQWFEWHQDTWTLPPGAIELAVTDRGSQAFALDRSLAIQFHPEMDGPTLSGVLRGNRAEVDRRGIDAEGLLRQAEVMVVDTRPRTNRLVDAFLDVIALRSSTTL